MHRTAQASAGVVRTLWGSFVYSLVLAGCSTGTIPNPPGPPIPPAPPAPSLVIAAPADGAVVKGEPVLISIKVSNVPDLTKVSVLLDGADITSRLAATDTNGLQSIKLAQPDLNYGKNQIQIRYGELRANSTFTLDSPVTSVAGATPPANASTQLSTIKTRVLASNSSSGRIADPSQPTSWGVQVGTNYYASPVPIDQNGKSCTQQCFGYQVLLLSRQDLTLISNDAYEVSNYQEIQPNSPFVRALSSLGQGNYDAVRIPNKQPGPAACKFNGCIMVMQSLAQIGYNPCYNSSTAYLGTCPPFVEDPNVVGTLAYWLTKLGASGQVLFSNGMESSHVGYSFIGNAGSGQVPGVGSLGGKNDQGKIVVANTPNSNGQFERMSCSDSRTSTNPTICDNLGSGGSSGSAADVNTTGQISGVLIRDNYNLFTFSQNAAHLSYTFGTQSINGTPTNVVSVNGSAQEGAGQFSKALPSTSHGGFRLLVLNRTTPDWEDAKIWDAFYDFPSGLGQLEADLTAHSDANDLIFLASMGDIQHNNEDRSFAPTWETFVQSVAKIGGDPMTLRLLGDNHPAFDPDGRDDYLLVGKPVPDAAPVFENFTAGTQSRFTAAEAGYVINRHTLANASSPTQVEGVLLMDHQGYRTPVLQGLQEGIMVPQITSLSSASVLPPTAWPYMSTASEQSAYAWISSQLCCGDIRSVYINLNASPTVWLAQIQQLSYPAAQSGSFSEADFNDVKGQLALEFNYLALARNLQTNILSLYQNQQSNVGLILNQAASDVKANIDIDNQAPTTPTPWSAFTADIFPVLENLSAFGSIAGPAGGAAGNAFKNALGIGTLIINSTTEHTNDPGGISQVMHSLAKEEIAVADVAQHTADEYTDTLVSMGNDFKRVVTDWGRLKAVSGPIATGQLIWDPSASGTFLRAFDLTTRRQFYPLLMHSNPNFFITRVKYSDTIYQGRDDHTKYGNDNQCDQSRFHQAQDNLTGRDNNGVDLRGTAWWPGVLQVSSGPGGDSHNPPAYWWDVWALGEGPGTNNRCPLPDYGFMPDTYGIFDPIDDTDNYQTNGLGLWKPYIFQYHWQPQVVFNSYFGGSVTP